MNRFLSNPGQRQKLSGVMLFLVLLAMPLHAKLPEPDAVYYGTARHNGTDTLFPAGTEILLTAELGGVEIASTTVNLDGTFVLKVPVDDGVDPRLPLTARGNEQIKVYLHNTTLSLVAEVNESAVPGVQVPNIRGNLTNTYFSVNADFGGMAPVPGFAEFMQGYGMSGVPSEMHIDSDSDGYTNLDEFNAGTDPTSTADAFRIIKLRKLESENVASIQYGPVRADRVYRILCAEEPGSGIWLQVGEVHSTQDEAVRWFEFVGAIQESLMFKVQVSLE